jgi:hypothetical protein
MNVLEALKVTEEGWLRCSRYVLAETGVFEEDARLYEDKLFSVLEQEVPVVERPFNRIWGRALDGEIDQLDMSVWHMVDERRCDYPKEGQRCGTVHCIGGWLIHLAGDKAYDLASAVGSNYIVAALILYAAHPDLPTFPPFYGDQDAGMAYIKEMAEWERTKDKA